MMAGEAEPRVEQLAQAVEQLRRMLVRFALEPADDAVRDSVIKRFEFSFELAWKSMRDWLLIHHPEARTFGTKSVLIGSLEYGLIRDADGWSAMLEQRNLTVHTYNVEVALTIADDVRYNALERFDDLLSRLV